MREFLSETDREQILSLGIVEEEIHRQLELLTSPPPPAHLLRPCRVGDGIVALPEAGHPPLIRRAEEAAAEGRLSKIVPASGAATRMFKAPLSLMAGSNRLSRGGVEAAARAGDRSAADVLALIDHLDRFAFFEELVASMARSGQQLADYRRRGDFSPILDHLLYPIGLGYGALPKGLILFHRYPEGPRTAFDEQLADGAAYVRDAAGVSRLHFTVPPEYQRQFERRLDGVRDLLERMAGSRFEVTFSNQERATDTVAVDLENRPFRREDGSLLLRPGGHGSLLRNLEGSGGDIVVIKNIDNVLPTHRQELPVRFKKVLAGLLLTLQDLTFGHLDRLASGVGGDDAVQEAAVFARESLGLEVPPVAFPDGLRTFLLRHLDRPLRVCGMVENRGEPGGGPFWVKSGDGTISKQIVESAQIDHNSPEQQRILAASTHFNPVDLVCSLRDRRGKPYDLGRFVDPATAFITRKSMGGEHLKALEHPGLWNGAMAGWLTIFVEVPAATFAPVKTVQDLLRPEHQGPA